MPPEIQAQMDRMTRIDQLAPEGKIKSEADARRLVNDLAGSLGLEDPEAAALFGQQLEEMESLFARAEFAAVHDGHRISEEKVAAAWNALMDEVGTPNWTRLTATEVHYERDLLATITTLQTTYRNPNFHPALISRMPDGSLNRNCRPAEAVYVLWMLQQSPSNFDVIHKAAAEGVLFSEKARRAREKEEMEGKPEKRPQARLEGRVYTEAGLEDFQKTWNEYRQPWIHYFETHALDRLPQRLLEIARDTLGER